MKPYPSSVSVTYPITPAIDRVKCMLFDPFELGKWFVIGFCAWLAELGRGGIGGGIHNSFRGGDFRHAFDHARDFVVSNWAWVLPLGIFVALVVLTVWVLIVWLSSRGRFMFLHCVALNRAEVSVPWNKFVRQGNSLFWFRLVVGLAGSILLIPLVALTIATVLKMVSGGGPSLTGVAALAGIVMAMVAAAAAFWIIAKLTMDFVVAIMFMRNGLCLEGWRELLGLLSANAGHFILYFLFQIVMGVVIFAIIVAVVLVTCCIAGCLMAIPYLGTVLLLPILAFTRSYSLFYLAQFGPNYDVFALSIPTSPAQTPPATPDGAGA